MFCKICGRQLPDNATYCDTCGAQVSPETGMPHPEYGGVPDSTGKATAALAYLGILFFLPLVVQPVTPYGKFHANQGLILLLFSIVASVALSILTGILAFIPIIGWLAIVIAWPAFSIITFVLMVIGIINGATGKTAPLPLIGRLFTFIR